MGLPDSYTIKPNAISSYFETMLNGRPPEKFSVKHLEKLGFTSTNDRLFIGILKDLGFLTSDGAPQKRYYDFLDRSNSRKVVAQGIREAFADLFLINTNANELNVEDVKNKLRTMYPGEKTDLVISNIAKTFKALCDFADFSEEISSNDEEDNTMLSNTHNDEKEGKQQSHLGQIKVSGLQYHINIVLPESRDQAVYDAIFKSLREHLR